MKDFLKKVDQSNQKTLTEQKRKEELQDFETSKVKEFTQKLSKLAGKYAKALNEKGFKTSQRKNFPYWEFSVTNPKGKMITISVIHDIDKIYGSYRIKFVNENIEYGVSDLNLMEPFNKDKASVFLEKRLEFLL